MRRHNRMVSDETWPYILPLPRKPRDRRKALLSALTSELSQEILKRLSKERCVLQKDFVKNLPYPNKTVIGSLNKLVSAGILECGTERTGVIGEPARAKWYAPTPLGRWFSLLLMPSLRLKPKEILQLTTEIFELYSSNLATLCLKLEIPPQNFISKFNERYMRQVLEAQRKRGSRNDFLVFGSAAVDHTLKFDYIDLRESAIAKHETLQPGGSAANVSVALARMGLNVGFSGVIGSDQEGRLVLEGLAREGVDLSNIRIDPSLQTLRTVILVDEKGRKRILVPIKAETAVSLESSLDINWNKIESCNIVYVGEVFLELAKLICGYARSGGKTTVYRMHPAYAELGKKIFNILRNVDVLLMNEGAWEKFSESSNMDSAEDLTRLGPKLVVLTFGERGCEAFTASEKVKTPAFQVAAMDTTGAGDAFAAAIMHGIENRVNLPDMLRFASASAAVSTTKLGGFNSMPTVKEVNDFLESLGKQVSR